MNAWKWDNRTWLIYDYNHRVKYTFQFVKQIFQSLCFKLVLPVIYPCYSIITRMNSGNLTNWVTVLVLVLITGTECFMRLYFYIGPIYYISITICVLHTFLVFNLICFIYLIDITILQNYLIFVPMGVIKIILIF